MSRSIAAQSYILGKHSNCSTPSSANDITVTEAGLVFTALVYLILTGRIVDEKKL